MPDLPKKLQRPRNSRLTSARNVCAGEENRRPRPCEPEVSAQMLSYHELQTRPNVRHRADLDIDEIGPQCPRTHGILRHVRRDSGGFLVPRDPDRAGGSHNLACPRQFTVEYFQRGYEQVNEIASPSGRVRLQRHFLRQRLQPCAIACGSGNCANPRSGLDAELFCEQRV